RRAGRGRRLEHHDLPLAESGRDLGGCALDNGEVRLAVAGQRGRQRDQDRVDVLQGVVVGRRRYLTSVDEGLQGVGRDVADVAFAPVDAVHDLPVHVDENDVLPRL